MPRKTLAIILAGGRGTRMGSDMPKTMQLLCGKPLIRHILNTLEGLHLQDIVVVVSPDGDVVRREVAPYKTVLQEIPMGTAHAVLAAKKNIENFDGSVLVVYGDTPLVKTETYQKALRKLEEGFSVVVVGFKPQDTLRYGRLVMQGDELLKIVEYKDASEDEKQIKLVNSGIMAFDAKTVLPVLCAIKNENAAGEYYLTDAVKLAREHGLKCTMVEGDENEVLGVNTKEELSNIEQMYCPKD